MEFEPHSHIALLSKNCVHWIMADLAIMMNGHVSVPIYPTFNVESINQILDITVISTAVYDVTDGEAWESLVEKHEPMQEVVSNDPADLATIIYPSGTTGMPKGVMHTAGSFAQVSNNFTQILDVKNHPDFFSYLPLTHIAERCIIESTGMFLGARFSFSESLETSASDLANTQPEIFFAVPHIWAKFQENILGNMPQKKLNMLLNIPVLGGIVKKKIQTKLGLSRARSSPQERVH